MALKHDADGFLIGEPTGKEGRERADNIMAIWQAIHGDTSAIRAALAGGKVGRSAPFRPARPAANEPRYRHEWKPRARDERGRFIKAKRQESADVAVAVPNLDDGGATKHIRAPGIVSGVDMAPAVTPAVAGDDIGKTVANALRDTPAPVVNITTPRAEQASPAPRAASPVAPKPATAVATPVAAATPAATPRERASNGRFQAHGKAAIPNHDRAIDGRFKARNGGGSAANGESSGHDGSSDTQRRKEDGLMTRLGQFFSGGSMGVGEVVDTAENIDPTAAAAKEVAGLAGTLMKPIGSGAKGLLGLFRRDKEEDPGVPWFRRIWSELRESNKKNGGKDGRSVLGMLASLVMAVLTLPSKLGKSLLGSLFGGKDGGGLPNVSGGGIGGGAAKVGKLAKMGKFLRRAGPLAALLGIGKMALDENDDTLTRDQKNRKHWKTGGSTIGAILGGAIGSLAGPVGTFVGASLGGILGDKVGTWLSDVNWRDVGNKMTTSWQQTSDWFRESWGPQIKAFGSWLSDIADKAKDVAVKAKDVAVKTANKANDVVKDVTGVDVKQNVKRAAAATSEAASNAVSSAREAITRLIGVDGTKRIYGRADGSVEERTGGTIAWRDNNHGNLKFGFDKSVDPASRLKRTKEKALADAQRQYDGVVDLDQYGYAIFNTPEAGDAARRKLLRSRFGKKTVEEMLPKYAVDDYSGKANHTAYAATIHKTADAAGVNLHGKKIEDMSDAELNALMAGQKKMEGYKVGKVTVKGGTPPVAAAAIQPPVAQAGGPVLSLPANARTATPAATASAAPVVATSKTARIDPPRTTAMPTEPRLIATNGKDEAARIIVAPQDVGQNLSDRGIAQLATGGMGAYTARN